MGEESRPRGASRERPSESATAPMVDIHECAVVLVQEPDHAAAAANPDPSSISAAPGGSSRTPRLPSWAGSSRPSPLRTAVPPSCTTSSASSGVASAARLTPISEAVVLLLLAPSPAKKVSVFSLEEGTAVCDLDGCRQGPGSRECLKSLRAARHSSMPRQPSPPLLPSRTSSTSSSSLTIAFSSGYSVPASLD